MSDYKEQNYWPGFVDALSNVVLTLVFVLVVFVFALVFSSDKLKKRAYFLNDVAQQETVARKEAEDEKQRLFQEQCELLENLQAARDQLKQLETRNQQLKRHLAELERLDAEQKQKDEQANLLKERTEIQVKAELAAGAKGAAELAKGNGVLALVFPRNVFNLDEKSKKALDEVIDKQKAALAGTRITLRSITGAETYTEGRRLAYFRGLSVRNYLIDKGLGNGKTIQVTIEQGKEVSDGRVEIRFHRP
jgi:septal ring factor EnvC (AmiA/AmiB activator)